MSRKEWDEEYCIPYIHCMWCRYVGVPSNEVFVHTEKGKQELKEMGLEGVLPDEIWMWYCPMCDSVLNWDEDYPMDILCYVSEQELEDMGFELVEEEGEQYE